MGWWADEGSETFWAGPVAAIGLAIIMLILGQYFTTAVSFDMLEFCEPLGIKDAAKATWANMGVTAALLLTLVAAMIQQGPFQPSGFTLDDAFLIDLQQTYQTLLSVSFLMELMCIIECVVYLSYVEPLSSVDAIKFFVAYPDTLGDPVTFLATGCAMLYLSFIVWVAGNHGALMGIIFIVGFVVFMINSVVFQWIAKAKFNPKKTDYTWMLEPDSSKWPSHIPYQYRLHHKDARIKGVVARLGKAIADEAEAATQVAPQAPGTDGQGLSPVVVWTS